MQVSSWSGVVAKYTRNISVRIYDLLVIFCAYSTRFNETLLQLSTFYASYLKKRLVSVMKEL